MAGKKKEQKFTARQKKFADEYLKHLNGSQAARSAGYAHPDVIACNLLKKPHVVQYIQKKMDKRAAKADITADMVLQGIIEVVNDARDNGDRSNALKGFELLGKHLKLFTDVQEQRHIFTQMGRVYVGTGEDKKALSFDIGDDPDPIDGEIIEIETTEMEITDD